LQYDREDKPTDRIPYWRIVMNREGPLLGRIWVGSLVGVGLSAVLLGSVAADRRDQPPHVAYISVQRAASQSTRALAAAKGIQQFSQERAREIADKRKEIEALRLRIAQLGGVFQSSRRSDAQRQEAREVSDLQRLEADSQSRLQTLQREAQAGLQHELSTVIADLARQRGIDLVLNQDTSVVWARGGMDWTDDVVRAINARPEK
jgi:Skp family chaperone for outer membrane proteins